MSIGTRKKKNEHTIGLHADWITAVMAKHKDRDVLIFHISQHTFYCVFLFWATRCWFFAESLLKLCENQNTHGWRYGSFVSAPQLTLWLSFDYHNSLPSHFVILKVICEQCLFISTSIVWDSGNLIDIQAKTPFLCVLFFFLSWMTLFCC